MIRMLSGCLCLCSAVFCCSLFHFTSVRCWCAVEQLTSFHSTLDLCFCSFRFDNLSSVSFFFASSRSWSFLLLELFLLVSLSCIAIAVSFDLLGPHVVMWLMGSLIMVSWRWEPDQSQYPLGFHPGGHKVQVWEQTLSSFYHIYYTHGWMYNLVLSRESKEDNKV